MNAVCNGQKVIGLLLLVHSMVLLLRNHYHRQCKIATFVLTVIMLNLNSDRSKSEIMKVLNALFDNATAMHVGSMQHYNIYFVHLS